MADTLAKFLRRTRRYLQEEDAEKSHWDDQLLTDIFNAQYLRRCSQLQNTFEGWFINVAVRDLTADQARYAWPVGFQRETKLELVRTDGATFPIQRFERHGERNDASSGTADNYLPSWRPMGNGFILEPAPIEGQSQGLRVEFEGLPAKLTQDGDSIHPSFPDQLDDILVLDTAIGALDVEGMQESGRMTSLLRMRQEWDADWERFIERRTINRPQVTPFIAHYNDA